MARGRKPGFVMSEEHRSKIANSQVLNRLIDHAEGKIDLTATQVNAINILLKKVMPDLQAVQHQGDQDNPIIHEIRRKIVRPDNPNG